MSRIERTQTLTADATTTPTVPGTPTETAPPTADEREQTFPPRGPRTERPEGAPRPERSRSVALAARSGDPKLYGRDAAETLARLGGGGPDVTVEGGVPVLTLEPDGMGPVRIVLPERTVPEAAEVLERVWRSLGRMKESGRFTDRSTVVDGTGGPEAISYSFDPPLDAGAAPPRGAAAPTEGRPTERRDARTPAAQVPAAQAPDATATAPRSPRRDLETTGPETTGPETTGPETTRPVPSLADTVKALVAKGLVEDRDAQELLRKASGSASSAERISDADARLALGSLELFGEKARAAFRGGGVAALRNKGLLEPVYDSPAYHHAYGHRLDAVAEAEN